MFKCSHKSFWTYLVGVTCSLFLGAGTLFGQGTTGTITGTVTDASGAVVPGARVSILSERTGVDFHLTTNSAGIYSITSLLPSSYTIKVEAKGFKTHINHSVELTTDQVLRLDVSIEIGAETQTITVEAAAPLVNTEEGRLSALVTSSQIQNMPLNGRNIYQLMQLVPGAVDSTTVDNENASSGGLATNVNGNRLNFNGFLLDGVANKGLTGGSNAQPSPDFVQEFRIMTNNISAEYGNAAGSVTDVSIKSGSNTFHGGAWEYFRNDKLNARNFFDGDKRQLWRQNQFGADLGGPIKKDRLFFFGGYEGERFRTEVPALYTFETSQWRQAVQTGLPNSTAALLYKDFPAAAPEEITATVQDLIDGGNGGWGGNIYTDPCFMYTDVGLGAPAFSGGPNWGNPQMTADNLARVIGVTQAEHDAIQSNINANCAGMFTAPAVQAGTISRDAAAVGLTTAKYATRATGVFYNGNQWTSRIDYQGDTNRIFGRFFWTRQSNPNINTFASSTRGFDVPQVISYPSGAFSFVHNFSPNVVNEFRFGYTRNRNSIGVDPAQFGVPEVYFDYTGDPQFGAYNGYPQFFIENVYQYADLVSVVKGKHNIKTGAEVRFNQENSEFNVGRPSYSFFDQLYFAADLPYWEYAGVNPGLDTGKASLDDNIRAFRNHELGYFVQDDWKVRKNLTLNLGLRWDYDSPHTERYGKATRFIMPPGGLAAINCAASLDGKCVYPPGDANTPNGGFTPAATLNDPRRHNFAPRFGFAWDPFGNGKTAIRGGFAISFQTNIYNNLSNSRWNLPFYSFNWNCPAYWCGLGGLPTYGPTNADGTPNTSVAPTYGGPPDNPGQGPAGLGFQGNIMGWFPTNPNLGGYTGATDPAGYSNPYVETTFFGIQHELTPSTVLEVNWVGNFGRRLFWAENPNRVVNGYARTDVIDPCTGENAAPTPRVNPCLGAVRTWKNSVNSNYNALQVSFIRKMSGGLALTSAFTWSHNLDFRSSWHASSSGGSADWVNGYGSSGYSMDPNNIGLEHGNSSFDIRHRWVTSLVWELPWLHDQRGVAGKVFGGWQTNYDVSLQSGFPFTVGSRQDFNQDGSPSDRPDTPAFGNTYAFKPSDFLRGSGPGGQSVMQSMLDQFPVPNGVDGNLGRNTFPGPGMAVVDFSLFKKVAVSERFDVQFRAEFFNLFNRVNLYQPIANMDSALFGLSVQAADPRIIQFGLRFTF